MWKKFNPKLILGIITVASLITALIYFGIDIYKSINCGSGFHCCNPGPMACVPGSCCYGLFRQMLLDSSLTFFLLIVFIVNGVGWLLTGRWCTPLQKKVGFGVVTTITIIVLFLSFLFKYD